MDKIGINSNVYCKLSGMVTEADHNHWKIDDIVPYVEKVIRIFGTDRVMYGSDWPVCRLAAEYHEVYKLLNDILKTLNKENSASKIFGENAARFYKLNV